GQAQTMKTRGPHVEDFLPQPEEGLLSQGAVGQRRVELKKAGQVFLQVVEPRGLQPPEVILDEEAAHTPGINRQGGAESNDQPRQFPQLDPARRIGVLVIKAVNQIQSNFT